MGIDYISWGIKIERDIQKRREDNGREKEF
jgi:hypothetical protein